MITSTHYYPYGLLCAETTNREQSIRKYSGKEFYTFFGLNAYNFEARLYDPAAVRFGSMDRFCSDKPHFSAYVYCSGDPIGRIDPSGCWDTQNYKMGDSAPIMAVFPSSAAQQYENAPPGTKLDGVVKEYNSALAAGVPILLVDDLDDFADASAALSASNSDIGSWTIVSQGAPGAFYIGKTLVTSENIADKGLDLDKLSDNFDGRELFIGACRVGEGEKGTNVLSGMSAYTGANVSAPMHPIPGGDNYSGSQFLTRPTFSIDGGITTQGYTFKTARWETSGAPSLYYSQRLSLSKTAGINYDIVGPVKHAIFSTGYYEITNPPFK